MIGCLPRVKFWKDHWVPDLPNFRILTPQGDWSDYLMVRDLMNDDSPCWNIERLNEMFNPQEIRAIRAIPLIANMRQTRSCGTTRRMEFIVSSSGIRWRRKFKRALTVSHLRLRRIAKSGNGLGILEINEHVATSNACPSNALRRTGADAWEQPPTTQFKMINSDASTMQEQGTWIGVIRRDHNGCAIECLSRRLPEDMEVVTAEAIACKKGFALLWTLDFRT
ncbi:hypothetical protein DH2020_049805 [Rehmannia glutinosa]|uniref:RNase H type-1 domain-containing protein n=1 Tax=Rehmannia glutinosa TaxID=99300 RepID=A0ABR0U1I4_REHGL